METHDADHAEVAERVGEEENEAASGGGAEESDGLIFGETNGTGTDNVKSIRNKTNRERHYFEGTHGRGETSVGGGKNANALHFGVVPLKGLFAEQVVQAVVRSEFRRVEGETQKLGVSLGGGDKTANQIKVIGECTYL